MPTFLFINVEYNSELSLSFLLYIFNWHKLVTLQMILGQIFALIRVSLQSREPDSTPDSSQLTIFPILLKCLLIWLLRLDWFPAKACERLWSKTRGDNIYILNSQTWRRATFFFVGRILLGFCSFFVLFCCSADRVWGQTAEDVHILLSVPKVSCSVRSHFKETEMQKKTCTPFSLKVICIFS